MRISQSTQKIPHPVAYQWKITHLLIFSWPYFFRNCLELSVNWSNSSRNRFSLRRSAILNKRCSRDRVMWPLSKMAVTGEENIDWSDFTWRFWFFSPAKSQQKYGIKLSRVRGFQVGSVGLPETQVLFYLALLLLVSCTSSLVRSMATGILIIVLHHVVVKQSSFHFPKKCH